MPHSSMCKPVESGHGLRRSLRKRKVCENVTLEVNEVVTDAYESCTPEKKTKKRRHKVAKSDKPVPKKQTPVCTPGTSYSSGTEKVCSSFRYKTDEHGNRIFSKSLIRYFMTADSPEVDDLKHKRFNTSFLKEIPRDKSDLQIFTEAEDNDPKWSIPDPKCSKLPRLSFDMPEIPGEKYVKAFEFMPNDEDFDKQLKSEKKKKKSEKGKKSSKGTIGYKGKPLSDEALGTDYISLLNLSPTQADEIGDSKETEMRKDKSKTTARVKETEMRKDKSKTTARVKETVVKKKEKSKRTHVKKTAVKKKEKNKTTSLVKQTVVKRRQKSGNVVKKKVFKIKSR